MTLKQRIKQMEKKTKIGEKNTLAEFEVTQRGKEIIELLEQLDTLKERIESHEN
jgi:predicted transcriptional regulator